MSIALGIVLGGLVRLARPLQDRPVVYRGHSFQLVGYGVFAMLAAVSMILSTALYLSVKGQPLCSAFVALIPLMGVLVWAGSRALHLVALGRKFWQQPLKYLTETGFYVQGGILGGMLAIAVVHAATDVDLLLLSDVLALSDMLMAGGVSLEGEWDVTPDIPLVVQLEYAGSVFGGSLFRSMQATSFLHSAWLGAQVRAIASKSE